MKLIYYSLTTLWHNKATTAIKVVSFALGLGICIILFTRIAYDLSYDTCLNGYENLYQLKTDYKTAGNESGQIAECYGGLSGALLEELPDIVESATTVRDLGEDSFSTLDGERIYGQSLAVDSMFFATMGIEVLSGNPSLDLQQPGAIYVSSQFVKDFMHGENPVGRKLSFFDGEQEGTIKGVFKSLPSNNSLNSPDILFTLPQTRLGIWGYDRWDNQNRRMEIKGNGWHSYIHLKDNDIDPKLLHRQINQILVNHAPPTDDSSAEIFAIPIRKITLDDPNVRRLVFVMGAIALAIMLITALNYVLMSISSLSKRTKGIGVHKCCGAGDAAIGSMFFIETFVTIIIALLLMWVILFVASEPLESKIGITLNDLFSAGRAWIIVAVVAVITAIGVMIPVPIFTRIPVTSIFRRFSRNNPGWKRALLFVEIAAVALIFAWLCVTTVQYVHICNIDKGYNPDRLVMMQTNQPEGMMSHLNNLPYVEGTAISFGSPIAQYPSRTVMDDSRNPIFSSRYDMCSPNIVELAEMQLKSGSLPQRDGEALVNEEFVRQYGLRDDSPEALSGRFTVFLQNSPVNVTGIVKDFDIGGNRIHGISEPIIMTYTNESPAWFLIKLKEPFRKNFNALNENLTESLGNDGWFTSSVKELEDEKNAPVRNIITIYCIALAVCIIITVIGLVGFIGDDIYRRSKEIAVRKINGASSRQIIELLCRDLMMTSVPASLIGTVVAWLSLREWLMQYSIVAPHIGVWYPVSAVTVLLAVTVTAILLTRRVALENPVVSLKSE